MKTLLFAFALSASVFAPVAIGAAPLTVEPIITRSTVQAERLELTLANLEQELTVVRLTNLDDDFVYYSDRIRNHNGFGVSLDLKELPAGRYVLSVRKGDVSRSQVILKNERGVMCSDWK